MNREILNEIVQWSLLAALIGVIGYDALAERRNTRAIQGLSEIVAEQEATLDALTERLRPR